MTNIEPDGLPKLPEFPEFPGHGSQLPPVEDWLKRIEASGAEAAGRHRRHPDASRTDLRVATAAKRRPADYTANRP